jgi:hypothetical protein
MIEMNVPAAPEERPERVDGEALRARVDAMAAEARRIDEALRARIGRWHSTCADCSD